MQQGDAAVEHAQPLDAATTRARASKEEASVSNRVPAARDDKGKRHRTARLSGDTQRQDAHVKGHVLADVIIHNSWPIRTA